MEKRSNNKNWEHFEHQADIGVRGWGVTKEEAFENAAIALIAVIVDPADVEPLEKVEIYTQACDDELLLADWLNRILYEMATRKMLFCRFEVRIEGGHLKAAVWGEGINVAKHQPAVEVKAATYNSLCVEKLEDGSWVAQCVVDV